MLEMLSIHLLVPGPIEQAESYTAASVKFRGLSSKRVPQELRRIRNYISHHLTYKGLKTALCTGHATLEIRIGGYFFRITH